MRPAFCNVGKAVNHCRLGCSATKTWRWSSCRSLTASVCRHDKANDRVHEFEGYIADLLDAPLHAVKNATTSTPAPTFLNNLPTTVKEETIAKARIVFGSKLAGPAERRDEIARASRMVAGVMVPPRPEEPDNCCMSGCVNCVWDTYRDEIEEWADKNKEARQRLMEQKNRGEATGMMTQEKGMPAHTAISMDDDGGGSETNWSPAPIASGDTSVDLFADIPVGIREFMKTEKKIKARLQLQTATAK